jgi:hypothetical protein
MGTTPENTDNRTKAEPLSDEDASADTDDGVLSAGSTATGNPSTELDDVTDPPKQTPDAPRPDALIDGNRVAVADDME